MDGLILCGWATVVKFWLPIAISAKTKTINRTARNGFPDFCASFLSGMTITLEMYLLPLQAWLTLSDTLLFLTQSFPIPRD